MGKGDKRTRKGKIIQGSYGKSRPKKSHNKQMQQSQGASATKKEE